MATAEKKRVSKELNKAEPAQVMTPFEDMERLFDRLMTRRWLRPFQLEWPEFPKVSFPLEGLTPSVDVIDRDHEIVVKAELPGVDKKDLDVSVTQNSVTIKGSTSREAKEEQGDYYRCEISRGSYLRTLSLPAAVDEKNTKAKFKDGVLELTLPKLEKSKRRTIKVE